MKLINIAISFAAMIITVPSLAISSHEVALATADTVQNLKTVDNYLRWAEQFVPSQQILAARLYLKTCGLSEKARFPKLHVVGNKLFFDKAITLTVHEKDIILNDRKVKTLNKDFDKSLRILVSSFETQKVSWMNLILPSAHAANENQLLMSLLASLMSFASSSSSSSLFENSYFFNDFSYRQQYIPNNQGYNTSTYYLQNPPNGAQLTNNTTSNTYTPPTGATRVQ